MRGDIKCKDCIYYWIPDYPKIETKCKQNLDNHHKRCGMYQRIWWHIFAVKKHCCKECK